MNNKQEQNTPLGVLLISTLWFFLGTSFIAFISTIELPSVGILYCISMGLFFILLGWGLLSLKQWAWTISSIISVLSCISLVFSIPSFLIIMILNHDYYSLMNVQIIFPLMSPFVVYYLFKNKKVYIKNKSSKPIPDRICPNCNKIIPIEAKICPYCNKKFEGYEYSL